MKKYTIEISETLTKNIQVVANDETEAINKVRNDYNSQRIVLDSTDFVESEFYLVDMEEEAETEVYLYVYKIDPADEYYTTELFIGTEGEYQEKLNTGNLTYSEFYGYGKAPEDLVMFNNGKWELLPRDIAYKYSPDFVQENERLWSNM